MSETVPSSDAAVPLARTLAAAILAMRPELVSTTPAVAPSLGRRDEVDAALSAVLVRYAEVMARLADA